MTRQQKMFNEIHREIEPMLEARRVADATMLSGISRGIHDGTVGTTSRNNPTLNGRRRNVKRNGK